jgi:hypothetical protein
LCVKTHEVCLCRTGTPVLWFWLVRVWYVSVGVLCVGMGGEIGAEDCVAVIRGGVSYSRCVVVRFCIYDSFVMCVCEVNVRVYDRVGVFYCCVFYSCDCVCDFLSFTETAAGGCYVFIVFVVVGEMEESSEYPCLFFLCAYEFV